MKHEKNLNCYDFPNYYELAFSFRDISYEVDVFEKTIKQFANCHINKFLDLACGPAFHMLELAQRGFHYTGLDISVAMIEYASAKAKNAKVDADFIQCSMIEYQVLHKMDYIFIALGSIYAKSTNELARVFNSAAKNLNSGGLFLLDWGVQFDPAQLYSNEGQTWEMLREQIKIKSSVIMKSVNLLEQLYEERLEMIVQDGQKTLNMKSYGIKRAIYPQEFLLMMKGSADFEFIGWWNNWNLDQPITGELTNIFRPIVLLRRK